MKATSGIKKKEILDYLRLEEDEDTAQALITSSFLHVGAVVRDGVTFHYWSYPTPCGVAWVSFSSEDALGTEVADNVPAIIKDATAPREKHPVRKPGKEVNQLVDRSPVGATIWVPMKYAPVCNYYPVWQEVIPFQHALKAFAAKATRHNVGYSLLGICIKLTSGRYAQIDAPEDRQESISISLELEEDAQTKKDRNCIGLVHIKDIKEILAALGRTYEPPRLAPGLQFPYHWRE